MKTMNLPGFTADASLYKTSGHYRTDGTLSEMAADRGILAQRDNDTDYTTDQVCKACGCSVSGFVCNCGARPSQGKLDCIRNGGPDKRRLLTGFAFSNVSNNVSKFF